MVNKKILQDASDLPLTFAINELVWIALSLENPSDIKDMIADMDEKDLKECFPNIPYKYFHNKDYSAVDALIDFDKFGFLAEINIAIPSRFRFENSKPVSWSSSMSHCSIRYVYAETTEELMKNISTVVNEEFEYAWKKEIKTK